MYYSSLQCVILRMTFMHYHNYLVCSSLILLLINTCRSTTASAPRCPERWQKMDNMTVCILERTNVTQVRYCAHGEKELCVLESRPEKKLQELKKRLAKCNIKNVKNCSTAIGCSNEMKRCPKDWSKSFGHRSTYISVCTAPTTGRVAEVLLLDMSLDAYCALSERQKKIYKRPKAKCPDDISGVLRKPFKLASFKSLDQKECRDGHDLDQLCSGVGQCEETRKGYRCMCWPAYTGTLCEEVKGKCDKQSCEGKCKTIIKLKTSDKELVERSKLREFSGNQKVCFCKKGSTGKDCRPCPVGTWGDLCRSNCSSGCESTCDRITGYCKCADRWHGKRCEQWNCASDADCSGHGKCDSKANSTKCKCDAGWSGTSCNMECVRYFGKNCRHKCGRCILMPCSRFTGECTQQQDGSRCMGQYTGKKCKRKASIYARIRGRFQMTNSDGPIGDTQSGTSLTETPNVSKRSINIDDALDEIQVSLENVLRSDPVLQTGEVRVDKLSPTVSKRSAGIAEGSKAAASSMVSEGWAGIGEQLFDDRHTHTETKGLTRMRRQTSGAAAINVFFTVLFPESIAEQVDVQQHLASHLQSNLGKLEAGVSGMALVQDSVNISRVEMIERASREQSALDSVGTALPYLAAGAGIILVVVLLVLAGIICYVRRPDKCVDHRKQRQWLRMEVLTRSRLRNQQTKNYR